MFCPRCVKLRFIGRAPRGLLSCLAPALAVTRRMVPPFVLSSMLEYALGHPRSGYARSSLRGAPQALCHLCQPSRQVVTTCRFGYRRGCRTTASPRIPLRNVTHVSPRSTFLHPPRCLEVGEKKRPSIGPRSRWGRRGDVRDTL